LVVKFPYLLSVLFLGAANAPIARHFGRYRGRRRHCFGSHVGVGQSCTTRLCVPARRQVRDIGDGQKDPWKPVPSEGERRRERRQRQQGVAGATGYSAGEV